MMAAVLMLVLIMPVYGTISQHQSLLESDPAKFIKFPNKRIFEPFEDKPVGQLKPLGMQRPPIGQIPEYFSSLLPNELWEEHVKPYRPAVFRNMLNGSPAIDKWSDKYLSTHYGDLQVLVEKKFEDRKTEPKRMKIASFLEQYKHQNWYVVSMLPNAMKKDVKVPKPLMCSSFRKSLMELNLWIGTKGTRSMLHYDADNILHCLVAGRKDWILIHPNNTFRADMGSNNPGQQSGFSLLNIDSINLYNNPDASEIPWEYVTLYAGDCIYLPPGYMHQVRSYNRSISTTFLFYPQETFNDDDCADVDLDSYLSLEEIFVYWDHKKGQETVDMGYRNPLQLRSLFLHSCQSLNFTSMSLQDFVYMWSVTDGDELAEEGRFDILKDIFRTFDMDENEIVDYNEVETADVEKWKAICRNTEAPHGPTKTLMLSDPKLSSNESAFNPRQHDHYIEAHVCFKNLKNILNTQGTKGSISYPEFVKLFTVEDGSLAEMFVILDLNMNGIFTLAELKQLPKELLKKVYRNVKITQAIDTQKASDRVPGHSAEIVAVVDRLRKILESIDGTETHLNKEKLSTHLQDVRLDDDAKLDEEFLFKVLDRAKKGYVVADDIRKVLDNSTRTEMSHKEVPEGIAKARAHDFLRGTSFQYLFYQLLEANIGIQKHGPSFIKSTAQPHSRDEL